MPSSIPAQVDPATVIGWLTGGPAAVTVLDVRSPAEFETRHIAGSNNLPLHLVAEHATALAAAGGPVVEGRRRWSLERQVRLVTGGTVLAGILASRVTPKAVLLAGGIGAGLTASALTDTCTMGRLLSTLPYNRGTQTDAQQLLDQLPAETAPTAVA